MDLINIESEAVYGRFLNPKPYTLNPKPNSHWNSTTLQPYLGGDRKRQEATEVSQITIKKRELMGFRLGAAPTQ